MKMISLVVFVVNGETVWHNGPVIEALEKGAILLLDEIDLASNKILCLQSILEGKGIFLKRLVNIFNQRMDSMLLQLQILRVKAQMTCFIGTNVLNEAFLERFCVTFEQAYPTPATEQKILEGLALDLGIEDRQFCKHLVDWADIIRKTFYDGGIEEVISTHRLVHILEMLTVSLAAKRKQLRFAPIALMKKQSSPLLNSMTRLMLTFLLTQRKKIDMIRGGLSSLYDVLVFTL